VADAVAQDLRHAGHDVERKDAEHVHGFEGADAVVLGSPIYGGRWL
jgi:menaquinone-dependent protoporphyrinogen IX oxidase